MHLKNFSLLQSDDGYSLSPAYDLVATKLVIPGDKEEMALTINGRKSNLQRRDFHALARLLNISERVYNNTMGEFGTLLPDAIEFIKTSFLNESMRDDYKQLVEKRSKRLELRS